MRPAVKVFVFITALLAVTATLLLWRYDAVVRPDYVSAAVCFCTLGLLAHALQHRLGAGATESIAFIPFLSIAGLAPSWVSAAAVGATVIITELLGRRSAIKVVFNISQYVLATSVAIAVYLSAGGRPLVTGAPRGVAPLLALSLMFVAFLVVNWAAVSVVVALHERRNVFAVWAENTLNNILYDFVSLVLLYLFVWVYAQSGPTGALILALPILGVRQLYKTNWLLEQTNQELLQLMVAAIEARDPYTSGHSKRVSHYSRLIARSLGLSHGSVERIGVAALLHDVGKIHEAFAPLLRKEGPLSPEERELMETHSIKSAELVSNVSQLRDLVAPIRHHHENWDGSGYPDGLVANDIPLASRVIMIADTIDAMTTDRPYRSALGPDDVRAELQKFRGRQFDPHIVDALLDSTLFSQIFDKTRPTPTLWRTAELRVSRSSRKASA